MHTPQDIPPTAPPPRDIPPDEYNPVEDPPVNPNEPGMPQPPETPLKVSVRTHGRPASSCLFL